MAGVTRGWGEKSLARFGEVIHRCGGARIDRLNVRFWLDSEVSTMLPARPLIPQHETFKAYVSLEIDLVRFN